MYCWPSCGPLCFMGDNMNVTVLFGWLEVGGFVYSVHNRRAVLELFAKLNQVFENAHKH